MSPVLKLKKRIFFRLFHSCHLVFYLNVLNITFTVKYQDRVCEMSIILCTTCSIKHFKNIH